MRVFHKITITLLSLVALLGGSVLAPTTANAASKKQVTAVKKMAKKYHLKGQILMTNNGVKHASYINVGYSNYAKKTKTSANTSYLTASVQKGITAAMIEQLVAKHQLSMSTKLSKYFPQAKYSSSITVRQLLNHTSGIHMAETTPSKVLSESGAVNYAIKTLNSTGNHAYFYSNGNYTMLAGIIRKVTHKSYQANMEARIIKPLKLKHTYAWNKVPSKWKAQAYKPTYHLANITKARTSAMLGAGSLYSNAHDYYAMMRGMVNGRILTHKQWLQMRNHYSGSYAAGFYNLKYSLKSAHGRDGGFETYVLGKNTNHKLLVFFSNQRPTLNANDLALKMYTLF